MSSKPASARSEIASVAPDNSLSAKILEAQDSERRRISRELHDSVGGSLTAVKLGFGRLRAKLKVEDLKELQEIEQQVDELIAEVRTISYLLHPPMLDVLGLRSSVLWYAEGFQRRTGIQVSVEFSKGLAELDSLQEITLFRILQESLTNIHRHAKASSVIVSASTNQRDFQLEITDDGAGISNTAREGVGVRGMRERVHELGGTFHVESGDEAGTSIIACLPLKPVLD